MLGMTSVESHIAAMDPAGSAAGPDAPISEEGARETAALLLRILEETPEFATQIAPQANESSAAPSWTHTLYAPSYGHETGSIIPRYSDIMAAAAVEAQSAEIREWAHESGHTPSDIPPRDAHAERASRVVVDFDGRSFDVSPSGAHQERLRLAADLRAAIDNVVAGGQAGVEAQLRVHALRADETLAEYRRAQQAVAGELAVSSLRADGAPAISIEPESRLTRFVQSALVQNKQEYLQFLLRLDPRAERFIAQILGDFAKSQSFIRQKRAEEKGRAERPELVLRDIYHDYLRFMRGDLSLSDLEGLVLTEKVLCKLLQEPWFNDVLTGEDEAFIKQKLTETRDALARSATRPLSPDPWDDLSSDLHGNTDVRVTNLG